MEFGANSREFERKILRPRKFRSEIRSESLEISRSTAYRCSQQMFGTSKGCEEASQHQAAWITARSRAISNEKFCGRGPAKIFGPKSAPNRSNSHAAQHADARTRCRGPLKVETKLRTARRHGVRRELARFRTKNFAARARENFRKFSVRNSLRIARNLKRHSMLTLATDVGDL